MNDFLILDNLVSANDQKILEDLFLGRRRVTCSGIREIKKPRWDWILGTLPPEDSHNDSKRDNKDKPTWKEGISSVKPDVFCREKDIPYFGHHLILNKRVVSPFAKVILEIFNDLHLDRYDQCIRAKNLMRIRCNLIPPQKRISYYNSTPIHTDQVHADGTTNVDHLVMLYYINDSDGETILRNVGKIKPKKGRIVIFDGSILHKAKYPVKGYRCILNFNFRKTDYKNADSYWIGRSTPMGSMKNQF